MASFEHPADANRSPYQRSAHQRLLRASHAAQLRSGTKPDRRKREVADRQLQPGRVCGATAIRWNLGRKSGQCWQKRAARSRLLSVGLLAGQEHSHSGSPQGSAACGLLQYPEPSQLSNPDGGICTAVAAADPSTNTPASCTPNTAFGRTGQTIASNMGTQIGTGTSRQIQLAVKVIF